LDIYRNEIPDFNGAATLPILWDKKTKTIVSNFGDEIIRMFNDEFNNLAGNKGLNLFPKIH